MVIERWLYSKQGVMYFFSMVCLLWLVPYITVKVIVPFFLRLYHGSSLNISGKTFWFNESWVDINFLSEFVVSFVVIVWIVTIFLTYVYLSEDGESLSNYWKALLVPFSSLWFALSWKDKSYVVLKKRLAVLTAIILFAAILLIATIAVQPRSDLDGTPAVEPPATNEDSPLAVVGNTETDEGELIIGLSYYNTQNSSVTIERKLVICDGADETHSLPIESLLNTVEPRTREASMARLEILEEMAPKLYNCTITLLGETTLAATNFTLNIVE